MDRALEVLFMPLALDAGLPSGGRTAFLRARAHRGLEALTGQLMCEQGWCPEAKRLEIGGYTSQSTPLTEWGSYDLVLVLPERQKERTYYDLARAMKLVRPQGWVLVCLENDWGASRFEKHLRSLAGEVSSLSKHHCRAFWAQRTEQLDEALMEEWLTHGELRHVEAIDAISAPGVFSWNEVDEGSQLLADFLPKTLHGRVADVGCGWGYLSAYMLKNCPGIKHLDLYEADAQALAAAQRNTQSLGEKSLQREYYWHDVATGLPAQAFDAIVMNPPFHEQRAPDPLVGHRFLAAAVAALKPHGQLWVVANRHLPYEKFLLEALPDSHLVTQTPRYKILQAVKHPPVRSAVNHENRSFAR
jgi:16S rRNA (guanine1207-N2)-methyltransferase